MTTEEILFFDRLSATWDDNEVLSTPDKIQEILAGVDINEGMDILDLGTGTGVLTPYLSAAVGEEGSILALDISEGMLAKARDKFGHLDNVTFAKQDFEKEEIEGRYDLIFLYCVYPHLHTPRQTLARLAGNNLKPEGKIIIAFPSDESFINNIHKEKKAESALLPPAPVLSSRFKDWGLLSRVARYDTGHYIIEVSGLKADVVS